MKNTKGKRQLLYGCLSVLLLLGAVMAYQTVFAKKEARVDLPQDNQFIIVSPAGFTAYKEKALVGDYTRQPLVKAQLPKTRNAWFDAGQFEDRYLLISAGDTSSFTKDEVMLSIDFESGRIQQSPTEHYAYTGAGQSDYYFYTYQATTEDGTLYQFDRFGRELASYRFGSSTTSASHFRGGGGKLYLVATQLSSDDNYDAWLFIFEEKSLTLIDQYQLSDDQTYSIGYDSVWLQNGKLYASNSMKRLRSTHEKQAEQTVTEIDPISRAKRVYALSTPYPNLTYGSKTGDYLIVDHEPLSLGRNAVSVVNLKDGNNYSIDIDAQFPGQDLQQWDLLSVTTDQHNKLYILTIAGLLIWDMAQNQRIAVITDIPDDSYYVWIQP